MPYKFLPDVATADVAFVAEGRTLDQLFESCGLATTEVMAKLPSIRKKTSRKIMLKSDDIEKLLLDFLDEIIFLKDTKKLLFSKYYVKIMSVKDEYRLKAVFKGEKINEKMKMGVDVKATTMHMFEVKEIKDKHGSKWMATVLLDI